MFHQRLWVLLLNWSDPYPPKEWWSCLKQLPVINQVQIPRYSHLSNAITIQLRGFAVASKQTFGTVVYLNSIDAFRYANTNLLCSKLAVASLQTSTISRLELSAFLLLARLTSKIVPVLQLPMDHIYLYSGSTIVLTWIKTPPEKLKPFVSNRMKVSQSMNQIYQWRHTSSKDNIADIISRGQDASVLLSNQQRWEEPKILIPLLSEHYFELNDLNQSLYFSKLKDTLETVLIVTKNVLLVNFLNLSNTYRKLINVVSYILKFNYNCKNEMKKVESFTADEVTGSELKLLSFVQYEYLSNDFQELKSGNPFKISGKLKLLPFHDKDLNIRLGGRLSNSELSFDAKHPIAMPKHHNLSRLILLDSYVRISHLGVQARLHAFTLKFWIIQGRDLSRTIVHECVICAKYKPRILEHKMGDLPPERCKQTFPFLNTGTDFAGLFYIKIQYQFKDALQKVFTKFVCLSSHTFHFEIVSDLASDSFIALLKRFMPCLGKCAGLFSDNAKTYIGAHNELYRLHNSYWVKGLAWSNKRQVSLITPYLTPHRWGD
ncbi:uncharacterized protein LOC129217863 [Uloborus diversus]|uniref:uncharacterized protein LOC129217863 n=1 Tax=Uloborus diversus TaxID=327109 RepID=UPI002409BF80|nr:uncharacterized protein LOC129217863 [Uloborus diversus]